MLYHTNRLLPSWLKTRIKIARARTFEAAGSFRYSRPALYGIDLELESLLPERPGIFLEIGANDGYSQSNTYALEKLHGWRGILIEPIPSLFRLCQSLRKASSCYNVACTSERLDTGSASMIDLGLMSVSLGLQGKVEEEQRLRGSGRRSRAVQVQTTRLSLVIDDSPFESIDLLSVDVEGAELEVLAGLDFSRHCPEWLLVETKHPGRVEELCRGYMQRHTQLTHHDYLFKRLSEEVEQ